MSRHAESVEQRLFVKRWRLDPRTRDLPACAIPNGGKRGRIEAGILKGEGVSAGAPDWVCFEPGLKLLPSGDIAVGLALEFKNPNGEGRQSPEQKEWQQKLEARGWRYEIVINATQAWAVACDYLGIAP